MIGVGRFKATLYHQRGSLAILVRRAALEPPTLASTGAPSELAGEIGKPGLILLCGPNRTEWLHAAVHSFNATTAGYLGLVEEQLEYLHRDENAFIAHREIGQDVENFSSAVGQADRLGADLIAVGDVPDEASAEAILCAAERGRSIVAAIPARDAKHGPVWFALRFLGERRIDARERLASVLVKSYSCVSPG
jgi:Tfp pilus assembly pilus retraction ATPase PilT